MILLQITLYQDMILYGKHDMVSYDTIRHHIIHHKIVTYDITMYDIYDIML